MYNKSFKPLVLLLIFFFSYTAEIYCQKQDSINEINQDTIGIKKDSIRKKLDSTSTDTTGVPEDTIRLENDTIIPLKDTTLKGKEDTLNQQDTIIRADSLKSRKDTVILETRTDSAIYYINHFTLKDTTNLLGDTTEAHIKKLIYYTKSQPIDSSLHYLRQFTERDSIPVSISDSLHRRKTDTLFSYLEYLINKATVDSTQLLLITGKNDSIPLWLHKNRQKDSSRMVLFDGLDNPAGLWLIPKNKQKLKIKLDENTVIEKTGFRRRKEENLPTILKANKLQNYHGIEMIFPQWKIGGIANLNFNQGYVSNWVKGGESSLSTILDIKFSADYKKGKTIWDNDAEYKFGVLQSGEKSLRKNEDVFEINSKFGSNARKNWYYSALINFTTQLFKGFDYPNDSVAVSGLLSPAYFVFSIGMDYKPSDNLTLLLSPISSKFTMMLDTTRFNQTKYGIPKSQKTRKEVGAYIKSIYKFNINKDIHIENKINLFTNYLDKPQNIDVDWEVTVKMNITDFINTTISTHLIYDDDVDFPVYDKIDGEKIQVGTTKKLQFKELLSVGVTFRF